MPQIQAIYHNTDPNTGTVTRRVETGVDARERVSGTIALPSDSIRRQAPILADYLDELKAQGRNVYSCAEIQALAKILDGVATPDFRKITFSRPATDGGLEYWEPCPNCRLWLTGAGGQYRLADHLLDKLQPLSANMPFFDLQNPKLFPPLSDFCR
jgi:hypothetical protein